MARRRKGIVAAALQCVWVLFLVSVFSITKSTTLEVSAWLISPESAIFRSQQQRPSAVLLVNRRSTPLKLYQNGGGKGKNYNRQPQKKDNEFFFNTTGLYYMNDGGVDVVASNSTSLSSVDRKETGDGAAAGTFGDIMSPTINDADLLFQDGLVTSETYSLADIYGISNPLDRMAVTANGNLQRLFSSYYDAPVVVEMVHCTRRDDRTTTASNVPAVWDRKVLLKLFGDQTFCTADSVVLVHSREVEDLVESGKVGIGQIFRHFNILPEFTLLAAGPTTKGGFWRNYTLESDLVTCSIHEVFCEGVWELSPANAAE